MRFARAGTILSACIDFSLADFSANRHHRLNNNSKSADDLAPASSDHYYLAIDYSFAINEVLDLVLIIRIFLSTHFPL